MIKKVDENKNYKKRNKTKKSKLGLKTIIIIIVLIVISIFTIIQSARLVSILAKVSEKILNDFVNGRETSYITDIEKRG